MTYRMIQPAVVLLVMITGFTVLAEAPAAKFELTLDDCVKLCLQKNPLLRAAAEGILASDELIGEARAPYYPEVKATAGYGRWQQRAFLPNGLLPPTAPRVIGPTDDVKAAGTARALLFDSGERGARLEMSTAMAEAAGENFNSVKQDLMLRVHDAFYRLCASVELKNVARQSLVMAEQHVKLATDRKTAGAVPEADVLRTKVSSSDAQLELVRAESFVRICTGRLNTLMGIPVESELIPRTDGLPTAPPQVVPRENVSPLLARATLNRPEIKAARKRIDAARSAVKMAQSEYGPKVRAEASYGLRDDSIDLNEKEYTAGVSVELPLFSGFSTQHRVAGKKAEVLKAEAEADAVIQGIQQEVWIAWSRLNEAVESVRTAEVKVKDARESTRMAEERYKVGSATITDLMDTQTARSRAEAGLVEASWNVHIAQADMTMAVGK